MNSERPKPRISVVIAAYNVQACLARTVGSLLAQEFQDFEVLIVDDGSEDDTLAVARDLASGNPKIRVLALERNQGPSAARNHGFAEARGEWIAVLDADDIFLPGRLGHLLDLATRRSADMVADDLLLYDAGADQHLPAPAFGWTQEHELTLDVLLGNEASTTTHPLGWVQPMWRRDFLQAAGLAYPLHYRYMEDFFLLTSALLAGAKIWLSPRPEYVYTLRVGPISQQVSNLSATRPSIRDVTALVDELIGRYREALRPHQVRALRMLRRRVLTHTLRADAIRVRRQQGIWPALKMLWPYPNVAWSLAQEKLAGVALAALRRTR